MAKGQTSMQLSLNNLQVKHVHSAHQIDPQAVRLFERVRQQTMRSWWGQWRGQRHQPLKQLQQATAQPANHHRYSAGAKVVAVQAIHGSVNRVHDFDGDFRPLHDATENRWVRVATAMMHGVVLPPVELIQVGDSYYVQDGHHRISVARALGFGYVDAIVEVWHDEQ
jgi:hypothetical protein